MMSISFRLGLVSIVGVAVGIVAAQVYAHSCTGSGCPPISCSLDCSPSPIGSGTQWFCVMQFNHCRECLYTVKTCLKDGQPCLAPPQNLAPTGSWRDHNGPGICSGAECTAY